MLIHGQESRVAFSTTRNRKNGQIGNLTGNGCPPTSAEVSGQACSLHLDQESMTKTSTTLRKKETR